jgi:hypothetical protein
MSDLNRCWTCNELLRDAEVMACKRSPCTGQTALGNKPKEIRPPQVNPGVVVEVIDYTDAFAGIGDSWDKWQA